VSEWEGKMSQDGVASYLKARPYFIHLCYAESCPNAVVEALCFGCPVVCNNIGAAKELVQGDGIVAACDKKFQFKRHAVNLNIPRFDKVVDALRDVTKQEWKIDRRDLTMNNCAQKYLKAFEETVRRPL